MIVLDTALIGAFLGLKDFPVPPTMRVFATVCFIGSLIAAFVGVFPKKAAFLLDDPEGIRDEEDGLVSGKKCCLVWAAVFLVAGFAFGVLGIAVAGFTSEPAFNPPTKTS